MLSGMLTFWSILTKVPPVLDYYLNIFLDASASFREKSDQFLNLKFMKNDCGTELKSFYSAVNTSKGDKFVTSLR